MHAFKVFGTGMSMPPLISKTCSWKCVIMDSESRVSREQGKGHQGNEFGMEVVCESSWLGDNARAQRYSRDGRWDFQFWNIPSPKRN